MRCVFFAALLAAGGSLATPLSADPAKLHAAAAVAAGTSFQCTAVAVWDGDGPIWCAEGPRIRLAGVAAREIDGSCRSNHPCPAPSGRAARDVLVRLLGGPRGTMATGHIRLAPVKLKCLSQGDGVGGRTAAWCVAPKVGDLSCAMVASGHALRWNRYWRRPACPA